MLNSDTFVDHCDEVERMNMCKIFKTSSFNEALFYIQTFTNKFLFCFNYFLFYLCPTSFG